MLTLFRNRGLTVKMMSGFALTALITLSVGWLGVVRVDRTIASVEALYQRHMQAIADLTGAQMEVLRALMGQKNALVAYTPEQRERHINGMRTSLRALEETLRRIGSASKDSGDRKLHAELETRRGTFQNVCEQIVSKLASNQAEEAFTLSMGASLAAYDEMQRALEDLVARRRPQIAREYEQSLARNRQARVVLLVLSALGCLVALGAGVAIARSVARPVAGVVEGLKHLEAGDLSRKLQVHSADEIGKLAQTYNTFVGRIGELLSEVQAATTRVGDAVSAMTGAARQTRSASAGPTIEETAQAMSRIAAVSERNAQLARDAAAQFSTAQNNATRGRESVEQMLQAVAGIHESSRTISNITKVVDEIAFQTRLLALNAAVEAAHAGEEGKGFNVVAEEVRRLADRSAAAAKDIKRLIEESVSRADAGREVAVHTGAVLEELGTGIDRLSGLVAQVSDSSSEQRSEVQSAVAAINTIDATMRENGRDVERLRELVAYFHVG